MRGEASMDETFEDFGEKIKVRYRPVAGKVIFGEGVFLEEWVDNGRFESGWESGLRDAEVNEIGNGNE
jgi:hypothetical protein